MMQVAHCTALCSAFYLMLRAARRKSTICGKPRRCIQIRATLLTSVYNSGRGWTGMAIKKRRTPPPPKPTRGKAHLPSELSKAEADLLWHMGHGYQLETSSLWDNPILRRLKDNTELRATANRSTIEALEKSGLIAVATKGGVVKPTVWRLTGKAPK